MPQNRGLQLGEEQAPLISLPDSRRPETAYASYSRRILNAGRRFLQILARQIFRKRLIHRGKSVVFISWKPFLNSPNYSPGNPHRIKDLLCSRGRWPRLSQRLFQLVRSALGWQRQELVILVSALAQSLLNFASVAAASDKFFFCARRLLVNP